MGRLFPSKPGGVEIRSISVIVSGVRYLCLGHGNLEKSGTDSNKDVSPDVWTASLTATDLRDQEPSDASILSCMTSKIVPATGIRTETPALAWVLKNARPQAMVGIGTQSVDTFVRLNDEWTASEIII